MTLHTKYNKGDTVELDTRSYYAHHCTAGGNDPCCKLCNSFLRRGIASSDFQSCLCCGSYYYCKDTSCSRTHLISSHWLVCSNPSTGRATRALRDFNNYITGSLEKDILSLATTILASIISDYLIISVKENAKGQSFDSLMQALMSAYPVPATQHINSEHDDEVISETYSLLSSLLFSDRLRVLWSLHISTSADDDERYESFSKHIMTHFPLHLWASLVKLVDCYAIQVRSESPFLLAVQKVPCLSDAVARRNALQSLSSFVDAASLFLTTTLPSAVDQDSSEIEALLYEDRVLNMLVQAASLANQPSDAGTSAAAANPFDGCGLITLVLFRSFQLVPNELLPSSIISHSCCPNVTVEVCSLSPWTLRVAAVRDIFDSLTFDFSKAPPSEPGTVVLGAFSTLFSSPVIIRCTCPVCSIRSQPMDYLIRHCSRAVAVLHTSGIFPSTSYRSLTQSITCTHLMREISKRIEQLERSTECLLVRPQVVDSLVGLRAVADLKSSTQCFQEAATMYLLILVEVLWSDRDDVRAAAIPESWCCDVCLSLGTIIFESFITRSWNAGNSSLAYEEMASPLGLDHGDMEAVYRLGLRFNPQSAPLRDRIAKLDAYRVDSRSSSDQISVQCFADGICGTKEAEISSQTCDWIIAQAEHYAAAVLGGWTTSRHYAVPTTDIPVNSLPEVSAWFAELMSSKARNLISHSFFGGKPIDLLVNDAFIVKYQANDTDSTSDGQLRQKSLPIHSDQSTHSFTIALNDCSEYAGGGTYFPHLHRTFRVEKGKMLCFRGNHLHGGDAVLKGTRYIIATFVVVTLAKSEQEEGREEEEEAASTHKRPRPDAFAPIHSDAATSSTFSFGFFS